MKYKFILEHIETGNTQKHRTVQEILNLKFTTYKLS